mgnify:CR=1 FL=1
MLEDVRRLLVRELEAFAREVERRPCRRCQLSVGDRSDRVDREPAQPGEIEVNVVLGEIQLVEIGADSPRGKAVLAQLGLTPAGEKKLN